MSLVDTHAHLDQEEFDADRAAVIERASASGIERMIAIGVTADSSAAVVRLAADYSTVYAAVGIQPNYCAQAKSDDWERIVRLAAMPKVVAIGETGLDRHWDYSPFDLQQDFFDRHLRLAQERKLAFVVHTRESESDVLAMLRAARGRDSLLGVMHSFTGNAATAEECIELGLYISFAGMVTFKKAADLRAVAASVPAERILVETDCPYLSPHPFRGKRNEPANLVHTVQVLADLRGVSVEKFAEQTSQNAKRLFGIS
ncbi:MAG TPA: TatD family hydrolase [Pirellulales bacterium]|jgi:TatD DNase family protein|nr:TatD family hydrolase [Pirellulales bacterium]